MLVFRYELIENFITKNDICIMNDKSYTFHSPSTKSFTSIDLSFCHPSLFLDYNWSVCEDQHNSDHFPIIIEQNTFALRITIQSGNQIEPTEIYLILYALVNWYQKTSKNLLIL